MHGLLCHGLMRTKIVFITGTDTGVGKTTLTALLLCYLRSRGSRAFALKPFCSGSRADAQLLCGLQNRELTLDEINPFYFPEPVAPLISARKHRRLIPLDRVVHHIHSIASRLSSLPVGLPLTPSTRHLPLATKNFLLIEGSGGLLVPLGEGYTVRDLIARLDCEVLVVSSNRLGTINHTLLTVQALDSALPTPRPATKVALMNRSSADPSSLTNRAILAELIDPIPLLEFPFLGRGRLSAAVLRTTACRFSKTLTRLV